MGGVDIMRWRKGKHCEASVLLPNSLSAVDGCVGGTQADVNADDSCLTAEIRNYDLAKSDAILRMR